VCCNVLQCVAVYCSVSQFLMTVSYCSSLQHTATRKALQRDISLATRYFSSHPPSLFPIQPIHSADSCDFLNLLLKFLHNITIMLTFENISPAARCFSSCQPPRLIQRARALRILTGAAMATHKWAELTCHSAPDLTIRGSKWACSIFQSTPTKLLYTPWRVPSLRCHEQQLSNSEGGTAALLVCTGVCKRTTRFMCCTASHTTAKMHRIPYF